MWEERKPQIEDAHYSKWRKIAKVRKQKAKGRMEEEGRSQGVPSLNRTRQELHYS